ncbi:MAG: DeoR/GlpR family DNA-binding transcription regulator [Lachnospiraceae bacterium]|nr:DeoR/GlpR family DNA-binding transcription regulator [Lachnospiraceae bacterium]
MLTEERFAKILSLVESKGSVTLADLVDELDASESTVRRDLDQLDSEGRLTRVRGGAIAKESRRSMRDDEVSRRKSRMVSEKESIGSYAAGLIEPDDFVYIDAGTTTEQMLSHIRVRKAVFVTNAVSHALQLSSMGYKVFILGGEFKHTTEAIVGEEAVGLLAKYNFTKGFFGANGITEQEGFTTPEVKEAMVKRRAFASCRKRYVLADNTKFGVISSVSFGDFKDAEIITDMVSSSNYSKYPNITEVER